MGTRSRSATLLLARSQARSEDLEASSLGQPLVAPALHPFTGMFAAPEHTVAFGSKAFRLVFPLHVAAMTLLICVAVSVLMTLGTAPGRPLMPYLLVTTLLALGLGARIAVHCWTCHVRAQRFGAIAWTIIVACGCTADYVAYGLSTEPACEIPSMEVYPCFPNANPNANPNPNPNPNPSLTQVYPCFAILFAVLNASHGMEFWHTALLAGLVLCDFISVRAVCHDSTQVNLAIVALVVTFAAGHSAQLLARRAFLQSELQSEHLQASLERLEHAQTSRERLEHDYQRLEYRLTGSRGIQLPTVLTPSESSSGSTTISSALQQDSQSVLSAPAATDGGRTALPAGQVLHGCPPPHATQPSTAGPSTAGPSTAGPSTAGPSTAGPSTAGPSTTAAAALSALPPPSPPRPPLPLRCRPSPLPSSPSPPSRTSTTKPS